MPILSAALITAALSVAALLAVAARRFHGLDRLRARCAASDGALIARTLVAAAGPYLPGPAWVRPIATTLLTAAVATLLRQLLKLIRHRR